MARKKRGKNVRKMRALNADEALEVVNAPHSIIINQGKVGKSVKQLIRDMREVMEPYTATDLQVGKRSGVKDFLTVAGILHVSHLLVFTKTELCTYLHVIKTPQGPTLTFRVNDYILTKDLKGNQKKPLSGTHLKRTFPLAILNSFNQDNRETKLTSSVLQNMFPSINPNKVNFKELNRHYAIKVVPHGLGKAVKKLMQSKIPDMKKLNDISDFVLKPGQLSDTEYEADSDDQVTLDQDIKQRGVTPGEKNSIRLIEIGPQLTLELVKIVQGAMTGEVMYHANISKTEEQILLLDEKRAKKDKLKAARKKNQQDNVDRKAKMKELAKSKNKQGKPGDDEEKNEEPEDDDAEWYRKEVGMEPDKETFPTKQRRADKRSLNNNEAQKKTIKKRKVKH